MSETLKPYFQSKLIEAGCDEVGRGCLAGPVVAAAVILPKDFHHDVLTDSKKLSKTKRNQIQEDIKKAAISWAVAEVSHTKIDEINILNASFLAMHRALDKLEVKAEYLLIDGNRFNAYKKLEHKCIVKGDSKYLSIAAASILAKTYRDDLMETLALKYPFYGWESNAGYPTKQHRDGIRVNGTTPFHRMSFQLLPENETE
jgi:ribonuclease HII